MINAVVGPAWNISEERTRSLFALRNDGENPI